MKNRILKSKSDIIFDTVNVVLLTLVLIVVLYPLLFVVNASISKMTYVLQGEVILFPKGFNLDAYKMVFDNPRIMTGYKNTIGYTLVGTAINLAMTIAGAYPLSRKDFAGRHIFTVFFTITMFFSGGLIPTYLVVTGLGLYNTFWVMVILGAVGMWNMIIMRTFFQTSIPQEIQEAAFIDGCSNFGLLFRIVLPLSAPIIAVMVIFYGVGHWNAFFNALIYLKDHSRFPLQLILREILIIQDMQNMIDSSSLLDQQMIAESIKYAVIIVSSVPVLLLYPFLQKYFVKGVMVGAIKG